MNYGTCAHATRSHTFCHDTLLLDEFSIDIDTLESAENIALAADGCKFIIDVEDLYNILIYLSVTRVVSHIIILVSAPPGRKCIRHYVCLYTFHI